MQKSKFKIAIQNSKVRILFYFLVVVLTFNFLLFTSARSADAHVLEKNDSIGAVMHVDPEDDPIVGQQTSFFFEFKDKQDKFKPQKCDCIFSILRKDKEIYSQPLFQNNDEPELNNASIFYTFSEKDVYKVKISGKPKEHDGFEPFTITYDIRVSREAPTLTPTQTTTQTTNNFSTYLIPVIAALIVVIIIIFFFSKQLRKSTK